MTELSARQSARPRLNPTTALLSIFALLTVFAIAYLMIRQTILQWEHRIKFPFWDMGYVVSFLDDKPSPSLADLFWTFRDNEHRPIVSFSFYLWDRNRYGHSGELLYRAIMIANVDSRYAVVASLFWCPLLTLMVITQSRSRAEDLVIIWSRHSLDWRRVR
jgi:hypothetical protein